MIFKKIQKLINYYCLYILFPLFQNDAGWEEYYDYIFPSDEVAQPHLKLLELAKKWKKTQSASDADENSSADKENSDS